MANPPLGWIQDEVARSMRAFKWKKLGRVFVPSDFGNRPWLKEFAQAPSALVFDNFVRVYFSCRPDPDAKGQYVSYAGYVDLKRANLLEILAVGQDPIMQLGATGAFDEFGTYPISVIRNGSEVRAYYGGWTRCESVPFNVAIGAATSQDGGQTFEKIGIGPVLSYTLDEPFVLSGPKVRTFGGRWYLWYIAGRQWKLVDGRPEPVYRIRMAHSDDGLRWTKLNRDLIQPRIEADEAQASPDVFYYEGSYHMLFCYRYSAGYRSRDKGYRIGYANAEELTTWTRNDTLAGLDISEEGWDSEMVSYPHVLLLDDNLYLFYLGNEVGRYGFGLAKLEAC